MPQALIEAEEKQLQKPVQRNGGTQNPKKWHHSVMTLQQLISGSGTAFIIWMQAESDFLMNDKAHTSRFHVSFDAERAQGVLLSSYCLSAEIFSLDDYSTAIWVTIGLAVILTVPVVWQLLQPNDDDFGDLTKRKWDQIFRSTFVAGNTKVRLRSKIWF